MKWYYLLLPFLFFFLVCCFILFVGQSNSEEEKYVVTDYEVADIPVVVNNDEGVQYNTTGMFLEQFEDMFGLVPMIVVCMIIILILIKYLRI